MNTTPALLYLTTAALYCMSIRQSKSVHWWTRAETCVVEDQTQQRNKSIIRICIDTGIHKSRIRICIDTGIQEGG